MKFNSFTLDNILTHGNHEQRPDDYWDQCTAGKPILMVIPPEGFTRDCPIHPEGHFIPGPRQVKC